MNETEGPARRLISDVGCRAGTDREPRTGIVEVIGVIWAVILLLDTRPSQAHYATMRGNCISAYDAGKTLIIMPWLCVKSHILHASWYQAEQSSSQCTGPAPLYY